MPCLTGHCPPCPSDQRVRRGHTIRGTECSLGQHVLGGTGSVRFASATEGVEGVCLSSARVHTRHIVLPSVGSVSNVDIDGNNSL